MINFNEKDLIPAIVQDASTGQVLMLAYMNQESLKRTLDSGQVWFYSRSRDELWHKGATSGSFLNLRSVTADCDGDALLIQAEPTGPVCHTWEQSCFFQKIREDPKAREGPGILAEVFAVIQERARTRPQGSYVAGLLQAGIDRIGKKVIEEAGETVIAAKNGEPGPLAAEVADLWFHSLVLLQASGLTPGDVFQELRKRRK